MSKRSTKKRKDRLDRIIGQNIRIEREVRRMTREEMAEMLDLTVSHMGLIERGERGATAVTLEKISRVLGIPVDNMFLEPGKRILSVRESRENKLLANRKKISALTSRLNEKETEYVINVIKGIYKLNPSRRDIEEDEFEMGE